MTRRGRPRGALGPAARAALLLASERAVTYIDVRQVVGLSRRQAIETVRRGRRDGWLETVGETRLPGVAKPVALVVATRDAARDQALDLIHHLLAGLR